MTDRRIRPTEADQRLAEQLQHVDPDDPPPSARTSLTGVPEEQADWEAGDAACES